MKKKIAFFIYCALVITGIALFLVFAPEIQSFKSSNNDSNSDNYYATKIKLNCNDEIVLSVGSKVELLNGYISVTPSNTKSKIRNEISSKNSTVSGISFEDDTITAKSVGVYTIKFLIAKSSSADLSDSLTINVVDHDQDTNVKMLKNNFTSNTTVDICNIFEFDDMFTSYSILDNENLNYNTGSIEFLSTGKPTIELNLSTNYLNYSYKFDVLITPQYTSSIQIFEENSGIINISAEVGEKFEIGYQIIHNSNENETQEIYIEILSGNVKIESITSPIISCRCTDISPVTLLISSTNPQVQPKQLTIQFV